MTMTDGITGRTQLDLVTAQLEAIDAWNRARHAAEQAAEAVTLTREMRLDLSRRVEARRREQQALIARAHRALEDSGDVLHGRVPARAVIAHRNAWLRESVAQRLEAEGVRVVAVVEDGADAAGTVVVEQPELLLVEDRLPTLSGVEVIHRARAFAPDTVVGAQCLDGDGVPALAEAGAVAVFTRRVPPADIAQSLLSCLRSGEPIAVG